MSKNITIRIDSSERTFPGGGAIMGPVYEGFNYIGRTPCDLKVTSYKFLVRSNGVFHSYPDRKSSINSVLECVGTFETNEEIFDITDWEKKINIELKVGEIITVKFQELDESVDYFELILFGKKHDALKTNDSKTVVEDFDKSDEKFLSRMEEKVNKIKN